MTEPRPTLGGQSDGREDAGATSEDDLGQLAPAGPRRIWREHDFIPPATESILRPATVLLRRSQIHGDPYNIRERLPGVQRIAWSLHQHGLLENLVVVESSDAVKARYGSEYELRAGSRRLAAIDLLLEGIEAPPGSLDRDNGHRWQWPGDFLIPCRVLGSDGHYEHLVENIERSSPHPWEVGRRLNEILSAGDTARELGTRLGRSNGWVTRYAHIGRGLAPELIAALVAEHAELRLGELSRYASIRDAFGDPDGMKQVEAYRAARSRRRKRPKRIDPESYRATIRRLQYLRSDMPVPPTLRPIVSAVIGYLEGGERPSFRKLESTLVDNLRSYIAPEEG